MTSPHAPPLDQAQGLRQLFAKSRQRCVPVVANPHVENGGVMLERLCTAFAEYELHTLVVDASDQAAEGGELAMLDLRDCIETLSDSVSYLAARGLPLKFVDTTGSTQSFVQKIAEAAPQCDVVLLHASPSELVRMLARREEPSAVCPLLLADDHPTSVTHAYGSMKLMQRRAGWVVYDLLLGATRASPRADRIALHLATCADDFLGAVVRDWARVDPATPAVSAPDVALRRLIANRLDLNDIHFTGAARGLGQRQTPAFGVSTRDLN